MAGIFAAENRAKGTGNPSGAGVANFDDGSTPEKGFTMPAIVDPKVSWLDYNCWVECHLDSGIAVHTPLPQSDDAVDSLGTIDANDPRLASSKDGVNLKSVGKFAHVQQRMASSKYRFCLKGYAQRFAHQVPIPTLKTVGGVPAIPDDDPPARAKNVLVGNFNGVPLYRADWEIWYTVLIPPVKPQPPPPNLAMDGIAATDKLPPGEVQVPVSQPDSNSVRTAVPVPDAGRQRTRG